MRVVRVVKSVRLAVLLAFAAGLVVVGVTQWSAPAGWVIAGLLLAGWSVLFLLDVPDPPGEGGGGP